MILTESINDKWFQYVGASHLISFANQLTGLCMKKTLAVNRLNFRNLLKANYKEITPYLNTFHAVVDGRVHF